MSFYPPKINERFLRPENAGTTQRADAVGADASVVCGTFVRFFLQIDAATKKIEAVRFKSDGCGYAIAAADFLAEKIKGCQLTDLHGAGADFWKAEIEREISSFPASRRHCLEICVGALHAALAGYRARRVEEFAGEKALICTCFGVSEETIERAVAENRIVTVEEVTDICKAGGGCGSCQPLIQEILDDAERSDFLESL